MGLCIYACKEKQITYGYFEPGGTVSGKPECNSRKRRERGKEEEEVEVNKSTSTESQQGRAPMQMKSIKSEAEYMYIRRTEYFEPEDEFRGDESRVQRKDISTEETSRNGRGEREGKEK